MPWFIENPLAKRHDLVYEKSMSHGSLMWEVPMGYSAEAIKHLEFIQNIITRMNTNSFSLKVVAATLTTALLGFIGATKLASCGTLALGTFIAIILWSLDAVYLQQEKQFRILYTRAVEGSVPLFHISIQNCTSDDTVYKKVFFSKTLCPYYGSLIIVFIIINSLL